MDKNEVKRLLPIAIEVLSHIDGIDNTTRNKMSAFGATVVMSGLLPAIAAFSKDEKVIVNKILEAMCEIDLAEYKECRENTFFKKMLSINSDEIQDRIINYSIAVKLALDATVDRKEKSDK